MTDKDFSAKLAAGMRRAKQPVQAESNVSPAASAASMAPNQTSTALPAAATASPSANPESPWRDLHPKRIWPD